MASVATWSDGDEGPAAIKEYRIRNDREYSVKVSSERKKDDPWGGTVREVGVAKVGGALGAFWVEFETAGPHPRFYSVWKVDRGGIANLDEILLVTWPYTAR